VRVSAPPEGRSRGPRSSSRNPRLDLWAEHFAWPATRLLIVGRTPKGRAPVEMLELNDDRHDGTVIRIRLRDVSDGYHPPVDDPALRA